MSKRVTRYQCERCGRFLDTAECADACAKDDEAAAEQRRVEAAWRKVDDESYRFTVADVEAIAYEWTRHIRRLVAALAEPPGEGAGALTPPADPSPGETR